MEFTGPKAIDNAIQAGLDLDGSPIPSKMLTLYREVMDKENARKRSGVRKSMRNRIVKTGAKHFDLRQNGAKMEQNGARWSQDGARTRLCLGLPKIP